MSNELIPANSIVLRGEVVELHSDVGQKFLTALCRESEGVVTSEDLRLDWGISDEDVENLGSNQALMTALRAELSRRKLAGVSAREIAAVNLPDAVRTMVSMTKDRLEASARKIDASKFIKDVASSGGDAGGISGRDHFTVNIITSVDRPPTVVSITPSTPAPPDIFQPITIEPPAHRSSANAPPSSE